MTSTSLYIIQFNTGLGVHSLVLDKLLGLQGQEADHSRLKIRNVLALHGCQGVVLLDLCWQAGAHILACLRQTLCQNMVDLDRVWSGAFTDLELGCQAAMPLHVFIGGWVVGEFHCEQ